MYSHLLQNLRKLLSIHHKEEIYCNVPWTGPHAPLNTPHLMAQHSFYSNAMQPSIEGFCVASPKWDCPPLKGKTHTRTVFFQHTGKAYPQILLWHNGPLHFKTKVTCDHTMSVKPLFMTTWFKELQHIQQMQLKTSLPGNHDTFWGTK